MTAPTTTPIARSWAKRLDAGHLTRGDVLSLTSTVVNVAYGSDGGKRTNLTQGEANDILRRVQTEQFTINPTLAASGYGWLRKYGVKLGIPQDVIDGFQGYRLAGIHYLAASWKVRACPIWLVQSSAGDWRYYHHRDRGTYEVSEHAWPAEEGITR